MIVFTAVGRVRVRVWTCAGYRWLQLEEQVHRWVLEQRAAGRGLSTVQLRLHAQVVAKEMNISDFAGGPSWCYRFMQRNRLSIRARTSMSQKLPADFQAKIDSFREFIEKQVTEHNVTGLWFYEINVPEKMRLIVQCDLYMFFSSSLCIFWLVRLILRSDL